MLEGATGRGRRAVRTAWTLFVCAGRPIAALVAGTLVAVGGLQVGRPVAAADPSAWRPGQVLRVSVDGEPAAGDPDALCAVAFAGSTLDGEYGAAVRILEDGRWVALETLPAVTPISWRGCRPMRRRLPTRRSRRVGGLSR